MEDCCKPDNDKKDKAGKMVDLKSVILWVIIGVLAVAVIYVLFFRGAGSGNAIASAGQASKTASTMVGGC